MEIYPKLRKAKKRLTKGGAGEYSYTYGWISAMQNKLIGRKELESYLNSKGLSEMVANLEGTPYEPEIQNAVGKELNISKLEAALEQHFLRVLREVTKDIPEDDRLALDQVFVREWDLKNLKSVLRGVAYSATSAEISDLFDAYGDISEAQLMELAKSKDVFEFIENLGETPYAESLKSKLEDYRKDNKLSSLEVAMDLTYLDQLAELESETVLKELKQYINMQNEALVLRNFKRAKTHSEFLEKLTLYHLTQKHLTRIIAGENIETVLKNTPYEGLFENGVNSDVKVERIIMDSLQSMSFMQPLGLASIILFIKQKQVELKNLRVIVIGMTNELEKDTIRSMLVI